MTAVRSLTQLRQDWEREERRRSQMQRAWPNLDTIRLDEAFARPTEVAFVAYAFFEGRANDSSLCSQLIITDDARIAQHADRDPAVQCVPETPARLHTPLNQAIYRTIADLGGDHRSAERVLGWLRPFGVEGKQPRYWARADRIEALSGLQERVAMILQRVFRHAITGQHDPLIHGRTVAWRCANPPARSHGRQGQNPLHEHNIRSAA